LLTQSRHEQEGRDAIQGQPEAGKGLLARQLIVAPPSAEEARIEVRTNGMVRPGPPVAREAPELFGDILVEWTFHVRDADYAQFQAALLAAERVLGGAGQQAGVMPDGVRYLGTYFILSGGTPEAGRYRTLWCFRDFAAFEAYNQRAIEAGSEFAQALRQLTLYQDRSSPAASNTIAIGERAAGLRRVWDGAPGAGAAGAPPQKRAAAQKKRAAAGRGPAG
jgi:hypothetical protein